MAPLDADWLYIRAAALARKVYLRGHLGVGTLQHIYGGKQRFGVRRNHHETSSGKIIRYCLQQLEVIYLKHKFILEHQSFEKRQKRRFEEELQNYHQRRTNGFEPNCFLSRSQKPIMIKINIILINHLYYKSYNHILNKYLSLLFIMFQI